MSGYPGVPHFDSITDKVANADLKTTGEFSCSKEMFNQIHKIGKALFSAALKPPSRR